MAKGLAGGVPIGCMVATEELSKGFAPGSHASTFGGNPLACAAATATLTTLREEDLFAASARVGAYFIDRLRALGSPKVREVRGRGLMIGVELKERATKYLRGLQEAGVLALSAGPTTLRFLPPLILTERDVDEAIGALGGLLTEVRSEK